MRLRFLMLLLEMVLLAPTFAQAPSDAELKALKNRVILLYQTGKYTEAIPLAERYAAQTRPLFDENAREYAMALNNLAYLEADQGVDLDQALAHAQRAQQRLPGNPDVQDTLALVYIRKNLTNDSIRMLRDLVSQRPDSAPFHLHLALALYQKGDRPRAKQELEAALRHQPSEKEQNRIRELLAKVG